MPIKKSLLLIKKHFPFESRFATVSGYHIHYVDEGEGETLLLLHGNPTWSFFYRELIKALSKNYRVIALDHIGCGFSEKPSCTFTAVDRINHLKEFVKALQLKDISLIMHDWGGPIGTGYAVDNPENVKRLIYLNTTLTETESLPPIIKLATTQKVGKFITQDSRLFLKIALNFGVVKKIPKDIKKCYLFPYKSRKDRTAIWGFVKDIPINSNHPSYFQMIELAEKLPLLAETPVKIIWGLKDPCFHREMLKKISRHFPRANIVELSNASHLVLEDNPEAVVAEIEHFLREPLPKAPIKHLTKPKLSTTVSPAIIEKFRSYAVSNKKQTAVVEPVFITDKVSYSTTTYYQMFQLLNQYERGLQELGLKPKDKVLMLVSPGKEFLLLSYAVIARGAIPVFLDPGMGKEKLFKVIKEINPDAFIGSVLAHILRFKKKTLMPNLKFSVVSSEIPLPGSTGVGFFKKFAVQPLPIVPPSNPVLIAFTSGATGTPKGVPFTDSMIKEILRILAKDFGLTSKAFDMPFLPIFSLFTLALGIGSVFPPVNPSKPLSVSAEKVLRLLNDYEITYSFGSPTIWNKIAEYCLRTRVKIDSMRKVFIAGAPVSENVLSRVKDCLESGEVFTPYGATEALPVTLCSADYIQKTKKAVSLSNDRGVFVGKPLSSIKVKIINWQEKGGKIRELEPLAIGEIAVSGENISKEYFNNPEATKLSKFQLEGKTWHKMGDLGYLDREGNLYFCGRKVHTVVFKDKILYSVCVENIFNSHSWVARSALVNLGENGAGIVIEPKPQYMPKTEEEKRIFSLKLREIADSAGLTKWIKNFFFHPSFPVDPRHNAKIDRIALSSWAQNKLKEATVRERETQIANI